MKKRAKIEIKCNNTETYRWWWWRLTGANGCIVCVSESFTRRPDAIRAAKRAIVLMQDKDLRIVL